LENLFNFEAVEGLNFSKMKVRMENHAVVTADVFFFRNCVVNNFVHLRCSIENGQENIDDILTVSNVLF
jgi:hypothetical protein